MVQSKSESTQLMHANQPTTEIGLCKFREQPPPLASLVLEAGLSLLQAPLKERKGEKKENQKLLRLQLHFAHVQSG